MTIDEIKAKIEKAISGIKLRAVRESLLIEDPAALTAVAAFLKNSPDFRFDYLSSVTGSDFIDYLESVYHLYSIEKRAGTLVLRVRVPKSNPRVPSLVPVYRGAEYQEREAYDMYGIIYEKHPDLRRLFMWDTYEGFPMRKDYQQEDSETLEAADIEWLEKNGVKVTDEMRKKAEELKREGKRALAQKPGAPEPA